MKLTSGIIKIPIERDGENVGEIAFNPNELDFAERYYALLKDFESRHREYLDRIEELGKDESMDMYGIPNNTGLILAITREICEHMRGQIDNVFGQGTSQVVFGDVVILDMFEQFFTGVAPYIQKARTEKTKKYTGNRETGRAVMK